MVGFGSTLRLARRPGWEGAYLDYETLKLLLSQIEVAYEETGGSVSRQRYRHELFLESDSDEAFASESGEQEEEEEDEAIASASFLLRHDPHSSSDEDFQPVKPGCIPSFGSSGINSYYKKRPSRKKKQSKKRNRTVMPIEEEDTFYNVNVAVGGTQSFYLQSTPTMANREISFNRQSQSFETTGLLSTPTLFYSAEASFTPPRSEYYGHHPRDVSPDPRAVLPPLVVNKKTTTRRRRRRRKKVPHHLRVAHAKARAITERFLGLMRAETEKVLLFAQARLGELADTAGSLRFPSFDDEVRTSHIPNSQQSYEFGDGGMHPSASSSSDDALGIDQWMDSSDDDESALKTSASTRMMSGLSNVPKLRTAIPKTFSHGYMSDETVPDHVAKRQIAHFEALRKDCALFQRNERILGEDMLFLSAVEEADAFTAVGVELIHVLKYISVNLIAVRKICRKHDRLLMNRMLGGYYQRVRTTRDMQRSFSQTPEDFETLGGLVARISGDIYEAHPALIGQMNHYKLVGLYDKKIQKLANSRTVQVVSSCLALALAEYEVARSRASALNQLNSKSSIDSEEDVCGASDSNESIYEDPPSTASSISLTRLRFTVMSIFSLREASREKTNRLKTYLARSTISFAGKAVAGAGLDGCSRDTLDFIVSYNPDSPLLLDSDLLYRGLKQNHWSRLPMADVMVSALATGTAPENMISDAAAAFLAAEERAVQCALNIAPESKKNLVWKRLARGQFAKLMRKGSVVTDGIPVAALRLNRLWLFLYTMNYYITHSTTCAFLQSVGAPTAHSATFIGVTNVSAIIVTLFHCGIASNTYRHRERTMKALMILATLFGIGGNAVQAIGISRGCVELALLGRFLVGFCSAEIIQRETLSGCVPSQTVDESFRSALFRLAGIASGLFIASVYSYLPVVFDKVTEHSIELQGSNWLMVLLWVIHFFRVVAEMPSSPQTAPQPHRHKLSLKKKELEIRIQPDGVDVANKDYSSSSSSEEVDTPASVLGRQIAAATTFDRLTKHFYGNGESNSDIESYTAESSVPGTVKEKRKATTSSRQWKTASRFRKLIAFHVGIPMSMLLVFFSAFAMEVFFSATPLITHRYFSWHGARSVSFLGGLTFLVLPVAYFCEIVARRYEERTVMKRAIAVVVIGLLIMLNWASLFSLMSKPADMLETVTHRSLSYDWRFGVLQYTFGLAVVFSGISSLEGASLSLLSKCSPVNARSVFMHTGTIATLLVMLARLLGDVQIVMVDLSHKLVNADIVNALTIPLLFGCLLITYLINKHFFFLM